MKIVNFISSLILGLILVVVSNSCDEKSEFSSGVATRIQEEAVFDPKQDETNSEDGSGTPVDTSQSECVDGDKMNFKSFPQKIQNCIDQGKLFDFDGITCTDIGNSTSFDCNFADLNKAVSGLLGKDTTNSITGAAGRQALLIACGEKTIGGVRTILAQWYYPSKPEEVEKCVYEPYQTKVVNACYRLYPSGSKPKPATSPEEIKERVQDCITGKIRKPEETQTP